MEEAGGPFKALVGNRKMNDEAFMGRVMSVVQKLGPPTFKNPVHRAASELVGKPITDPEAARLDAESIVFAATYNGSSSKSDHKAREERLDALIKRYLAFSDAWIEHQDDFKELLWPDSDRENMARSMRRFVWRLEAVKRLLATERESLWSGRGPSRNWVKFWVACSAAEIYQRRRGEVPTYGIAIDGSGNPSTAYCQFLVNVYEVLGWDKVFGEYAGNAVRYLSEKR